jgi:hypothetical protein
MHYMYVLLHIHELIMRYSQKSSVNFVFVWREGCKCSKKESEVMRVIVLIHNAYNSLGML